MDLFDDIKMPPSLETLPFNTSTPNRPINKQSAMIVVSNRLPFVLKRDEDGILHRKASAGGLVTAVAPVVIDCDGIWVGWTGLHDFNEKVEKIPESEPDDMAPTAGLLSRQAVAVDVDEKLFDMYYNGCCNETYWPLFHSMPDRAIFNSDTWAAYVKVNDLFALKTLEAVRMVTAKRLEEEDESNYIPPPIVWIHDYHLMLAANTIRSVCMDEGLEIRMGFFLHIPFPSFDIIRIFPWVDEILMGMLGCDLVGFHIEDYCLNFVDCCQRILGTQMDRKRMLVQHHGRQVQVKALPIGIPYERFESLSKTSPRVFSNDAKIILGVDRLDYTKGLVARLKALECMYSSYPEWIGKVTFLQVAVPSRIDVKEYQELKAEIDKLVGHINGKFSTPAWSPIRYMFGSVPQQQLAAYYRDADVALITPLRDGMNLVAKEFVACQDDNNPGVLVLSPFAGAGGLMHEALMANPYETNIVAAALDRALSMHFDERQMRMSQLKKREKRMDVDAWVRGFLAGMSTLHGPAARTTEHGIMGSEFDMTLGHYVEMCTKLGIIIDFDGTLSPLARTPELAFIPPEAKKALERLANMADVHVVVISGRELEDLRKKVGVEGLTYAGNHGLLIQHPDGHRYRHTIPQDYQDRLTLLDKELRETVACHGAWVENKELLVAWHYREVDRSVKVALMAKAKEIYTKHNFEVLTVSKRFENVPPMGWDRGDSCIHILRSLFGVDWEERVKVVYAGDSAADELAIKRLKGVAYTFRVMNEDSTVITRTDADYRLAGTDGVLSLLKFLERKLVGKTPKTLSRASSVISVGGPDRDMVEFTDGQTSPEQIGGPTGTTTIRRRTCSQGSKGFRSRTSSQGSNGSLRRKTLNYSLQSRLSRDEGHHVGSP